MVGPYVCIALVHDYLALGHIRYKASLPWTFKPLKPGFLQVAQPFRLLLHLIQPYGPWPLEVALALAFGFFSLLAPLALSVLAVLAAAGLFIFWACCFSNMAWKACWFHWSSVLVALPFHAIYSLVEHLTQAVANQPGAPYGVPCLQVYPGDPKPNQNPEARYFDQMALIMAQPAGSSKEPIGPPLCSQPHMAMHQHMPCSQMHFH